MVGHLDATTFVDRVVTGGEDLARVMGLRAGSLVGARVHLLWEDVPLDEALSTAAALRASGAIAEANGIVRAVVDVARHLRLAADGGNRPQ